MKDVVLAFDEGRDAGLGHRRRCEALAAALADLGVSARLTGTDDAPGAHVVVVDSYRHRADDADRFPAARRVAIDDLERALATDLLVDPNPGRSVDDVAGRVLSGPAYALVDPRLRERSTASWDRDRRPVVLVTIGAADSEGVGASIAAALARDGRVDVRLVRGPWSQSGVEGDAAYAVLDAPDGLAHELAAADLVVTAAGVTMLESLVLGRPTVAVVVAGNQRRQADGAAAAGAAVVVAPGDAAAAVFALLADHRRREELVAAGPRYVDGQGAARVAEEIVSLG